MAATPASLLATIWPALGGDPSDAGAVVFTGTGSLPCAFPTTELAAASLAAAALALARYAHPDGPLPPIAVDRRQASFWFDTSYQPIGWPRPPTWDAVAGDYPTADGWIRLHTNAPHHRAAALAVLGTPPDRAAVASAVATWQADQLESAIVAHGGVAAAMRTQSAWATHPQGTAVAAEPLVHTATTLPGSRPSPPADPARPLAGIRVLDLTRMLAGPMATRFLAGFGADILRVDPPGWDEPSLLPDVTLGKRCTRLDLRTPAGHGHLLDLLAQADILVHGYRPDALARLGLGPDIRARTRPGLVDVALCAYGWTGPWALRRGFDSLVQMSSGLADTGMRHFARDRPTPLPVQALDHATGYLAAATALQGLSRRQTDGTGSQSHLSLARTARLLAEAGPGLPAPPPAPPTRSDEAEIAEQTIWGPLHRLRPAIAIAGTPQHWLHPAGELGTARPTW